VPVGDEDDMIIAIIVAVALAVGALIFTVEVKCDPTVQTCLNQEKQK
jgi:hypothetical protein